MIIIRFFFLNLFFFLFVYRFPISGEKFVEDLISSYIYINSLFIAWQKYVNYSSFENLALFT